MDEQNKNERHGCCNEWGMYGHNPWYHLIRFMIGIFIIIIVFSFGVMIGEVKGSLESNIGYRMMGYQYGNGSGYTYPMMQNWSSAPQTGTSPAKSTVTP